MQYKYVNTYLLLGIEGVIGGFIMTVIILCIGNYTCSIESELCNIGQPIDSFVSAYSFIFSHFDYLVLFIFHIYHSSFCFILYIYETCPKSVTYHDKIFTFLYTSFLLLNKL